MGKIYYDATQLVHWAGGLTGIPRVMYELGVRFLRDDNMDTSFVSWSKHKNSFLQVDFDLTMKTRGKNIHYVNSLHVNDSTRPVSESRYVRVAMKGGAKVARKLSPSLAAKVTRKVEALTVSDSSKVTPGVGDVVVITWGEWWDNSFIDHLKELNNHGVKIVQLIHDLGPLVQPQFSDNSTESLGVYCRNILPISSMIITISKNTEKDIKFWLKDNNLPVGQIRLFREGDDFEFSSSTPVTDQKFMKDVSGHKGFLLSVGTVEAKKNHQLLYYVYKLAASKNIDLPPIAIVGRRGWKTDDMYSIATNDPETKNKMLFLHDIDDGQLSWLYDNCLFSVFMSFYEGWGIPIAESIARGVPCICSNASSTVEVAEGFTEHFNPASPDECLSKIQYLLKSNNLKSARDKVRQYTQFTWDESYEQFRKIVKEVV